MPPSDFPPSSPPSSSLSNNRNQNHPSNNSNHPLFTTAILRHPSNPHPRPRPHRLTAHSLNRHQQRINSTRNPRNPISSSVPSSFFSSSIPKRTEQQAKPGRCSRTAKPGPVTKPFIPTSGDSRKRKASDLNSPTLNKSIVQSEAQSTSSKKPISGKATSSPRTASPIQIPQSSMVFQSHTNYLSAKVQVVFENEGVLDMLGGPNTGTSYSLPGHVIISLPALLAPLEGKLREIKDLKLVMEGKSEFWDDHGRYTPMRLHTTTLTLATPSNPLLLPSHDPARTHAQRIQLAVPFDMRLPGWLPPSHDTEMTTISYGIVAQATIEWTQPASTTYSTPSAASSSSSSLSPSINDYVMETAVSFRTRTKSSKAFDSLFSNHSLLAKSVQKSDSKWSPFTIQRHRLPSAVNASSLDRADRHFTLKPEADSASPVECVVTVPDWVDVNGEESSLKISLRVRARRSAIQPQPQAVDTNSASTSTNNSTNNSTSDSATSGGSTGLESVPMERQRGGGGNVVDKTLTSILELGMEVEEIERFSSQPSQSFTSSFPIPAEQPSRNSSQHQLISPRGNYADGGLLGYDDTPFKGMRTTPCLLSDDGNQRNFFFANDGLGLGDAWRRVNVVLPMPKLDSLKASNRSSGGRPRSEMDSPFLRIRHNLKIRVVCRNLGSSEDTVVVLTTPIKFGTSPSTIPTSKPKPVPLPAYIQLFHENGDLRECDALPIYTKSDHSSESPSETSIPDSPTPSYASLYPLTARPCQSRSPSPLNYDDISTLPSSSSGSSLGRRDRSSSPSPSSSSSSDEPMDVDSVISSDEDQEESRLSSSTARTALSSSTSSSSSSSTTTSNQSRVKIARTIPARAIRINA